MDEIRFVITLTLNVQSRMRSAKMATLKAIRFRGNPSWKFRVPSR